MSAGVSAMNLPPASIVSDLLAVRTEGGVKSAVRIEIEKLLQQLLASAAMQAALSAVAMGAQNVDPVAAATTAAVSLATLIAGSTLDGVVLAAGMRVLAKDLASSAQNGIYVIAASGPPSRSADADTGPELRGLVVFVSGGTENGGTQWTVNYGSSAITIGTTPVVFRKSGDQRAVNAALATLSTTVAAQGTVLANRQTLVASGANAAPVASDPSGDAKFLMVEGGVLETLTLTRLTAMLEAALSPREYEVPLTVATMVGATSEILFPADPLRTGMLAQFPDGIEIVWRSGGLDAEFDTFTGFSTRDGGGSGIPMGTGAIAGIARRTDGAPLTTSVPVYVTFYRTASSPAPALTAGAKVIARFTEPMDIRYSDLIRTSIDQMAADGDWGLDVVPYMWIPGSTPENTRFNLANMKGPKHTLVQGANGNGLVITPYVSLQGNGVDAYANSNLNMDAMGLTATEHALAAKALGTTVDGTGFLMGFSNSFSLQPNRTATLGATKTGSTHDTVPTGGPGRSVALARHTDTGYEQFANGDFIANVARPNPPLVAYPMLLGAVGGPASFLLPTTVPIGWAFCGKNMTRVRMTRITAKLNAIAALGATIAAGG